MKKIVTACLILLCSLTHAQVKVPGKIIGNWINQQTNNWEYGFFEHFAIYRSGFWDYESVQSTGNTIKIKLKRGVQSQTLVLTDPANSDSSITIGNNREAGVKFRPFRTGFVPYAKEDHKTFKNSHFQSDTVTIIGYYRNLQKYNQLANQEQGKGPFTVTIPDFIQDKEVNYITDFDSLGRFTIKFPVLNTQQVFLDWERLTQQDVVEPGETIFLFADMADYIWSSNDDSSEAYVAFENRPKQILYTGAEARFHNELANYKTSDAHIDRLELVKKVSSDMDFLSATQANYNTRMRHLENYINRYPTLSDRFKTFQYAYEKYQMAFYLMQHRFDKFRSKDPFFNKGYMEYIHANMTFDNEQLFTLVPDYAIFTRDYLGYYKDVTSLKKDPESGELRGITVWEEEAMQYLAEQGVFNDQEKKLVAAFAALRINQHASVQNISDSSNSLRAMWPGSDSWNSYMALRERPEVKNVLSEVSLMLLKRKTQAAELQLIDSLFSNKALYQLMIARQLCKSMDHDHVPLSADELHLLNERLTIQSIKNYIMEMHNHYLSISDQQVAYPASLKNTDHLKDVMDADSLFQQLIAPYKGKVIYVDFWGTWCMPCMEQMPYAAGIKKEFAGKDVVFMYFASNSPEKSWKNVIKQMNLSGENVIHYRLSNEQERLIEKKVELNGYPTYLLIAKDGKLVSKDAPRPQLNDQLIPAINKLLAE